MRNIVYTFVEVQCSVLFGRWQDIAPNGLLGAIPAKAGTGGCVVEYFQEVVRMAERLGDYQLVRLLGRGGFAEVYLGEHLRLGTYAAVKVLYARLASPGDIEGFEKEARTALLKSRCNTSGGRR